MRPLRLWQRVGPPTWKRSGTLVFTAVMGVLLIGGTAMAANLGLLTSTTPGDRDYRLDVRRPALSVTLPTTEPAPPSVESTPNLDDGDGDGDDDDADVADNVATDNAPAAERSAGDEPADADGSGDGADSTPDREADAHDDADDHHHDDAESTSERQRGDTHRHRVEAGGGRWQGGEGRFHGDGSLDDD